MKVYFELPDKWVDYNSPHGNKSVWNLTKTGVLSS